ncbi:MAG: acetolactate synthase small subunit [Candidatus Omnitrophica bacterium]|nr:acetolactate synthase small subunit [Candidatus Omnitrophota bacterium]MDD5310841.1 acetolactate synthase small subunit [Candidatus Omnitrophota bacterium]MDD5546774.1 acetolactate synthase small subunit [Candidatus Omnitrophota bacterium]
MRQTISVLVENHPGVLARISGLFSARGFNIDSLAVGETEDPSVSRMTIIAEGDERTLEQIKKQLNKLIDVITITDLTKTKFIDRELILIKVGIHAQNDRTKIIEIAETMKANVADLGLHTITVEAVGETSHIDDLIELLRQFGIKEIVRTGKIAMETESKEKPKTIKEEEE